MGPYAAVILGSYLFTALVVGGLVARAVLDHRTQAQALAVLEARRRGRRSAGHAGTILAAAEAS